MEKVILIFLILTTNHFKGVSQEKITIFSNQEMDTNNLFMQGFLHGGSGYLDSVKVAKLKPKFWRIGSYFLAGSGYQETKRFNPKITININDLYMIVNNISTQTQSQPWVNDWNAWDSLVTKLATNSINNNEPVDQWDVWNEPDNFWTGTYSQWIEMYKRTKSIITSIIPNAKIVGPEFGFAKCNFNVATIIQFLDSLYSVGSGVSGVSWHEFCDPELVPIHVKQVRDSLGKRPWLGDLDILISEYASPTNHTIPGWNVGWLYYFEKSKIDWVSHACWDETDGTNIWSNCHLGLNGLFMSDNQTPQPNYWVHRAYAELNPTRIVCNSSHAKTIGLASKNDLNKEMKILVGKYDNPNLGSHNAPANVEVKINSFPYCSDCSMPVVIQRIPSNNVPYSIPLSSPITIYSETITFTGDSASLNIYNFVDGDSYIIYINPSANSILNIIEPELLSNKFRIYPNPAINSLSIETTYDERITLQIFNSLGMVVKEVQIEESTQLDTSLFTSGVYFIRNSQFLSQPLKFIKQ